MPPAELSGTVGKRFLSRLVSQRSAAERRAKVWAKLRPAPHRNAFQRNLGCCRNTAAWMVRSPIEKLRRRAGMAALEYHRQDQPKLDDSTRECEFAKPFAAAPPALGESSSETAAAAAKQEQPRAPAGARAPPTTQPRHACNQSSAQQLNGSTAQRWLQPNPPPYIRRLRRRPSDPARESFGTSPARSKQDALPATAPADTTLRNSSPSRNS